MVAGWANVSGVHMPAQSCAAKDYERLYGGCDDRVLAFSNLYAAFDGFGDGAPAQGWLESQLTPALFSDTPSVAAKAEKVVSRLKRERGSFSCVHLTELDTAVINSGANSVSLLAHAESAFSVLTAAASKVPAWLCLGRSLWRKGMPDVQHQYSTTEERNQERDTEYAKKGDPG